jgi:hypothetical protein
MITLTALSAFASGYLSLYISVVDPVGFGTFCLSGSGMHPGSDPDLDLDPKLNGMKIFSLTQYKLVYLIFFIYNFYINIKLKMKLYYFFLQKKLTNHSKSSNEITTFCNNAASNIKKARFCTKFVFQIYC